MFSGVVVVMGGVEAREVRKEWVVVRDGRGMGVMYGMGGNGVLMGCISLSLIGKYMYRGEYL